MNSIHKPIYCLDTSAFVDMVHDQPEEVYPGLWNCMGNLADAGRLIMVEIAYKECKDPEAQQWLETHSGIRRPMSAEVLTCVSRLQSDLIDNKQYIVKPDSLKSEADPFVIALAMCENLERCGSYSSGDVVVVHHEGATNNKIGKVKITDVCRRYKIDSYKIIDAVRKENWIFDLRGA